MYVVGKKFDQNFSNEMSILNNIIKHIVKNCSCIRGIPYEDCVRRLFIVCGVIIEFVQTMQFVVKLIGYIIFVMKSVLT